MTLIPGSKNSHTTARSTSISSLISSIGLAASLLTATPTYADGIAQKSGSEIKVAKIAPNVSELSVTLEFINQILPFLNDAGTKEITTKDLQGITTSFLKLQYNPKANSAIPPETSKTIRKMLHDMYVEALKNGYTVQNADELAALNDNLIELGFGDADTIIWGKSIPDVDFVSPKVITSQSQGSELFLEKKVGESSNADTLTSTLNNQSIVTALWNNDLSKSSQDNLKLYALAEGRSNNLKFQFFGLNTEIARLKSNKEKLEQDLREANANYSQLETDSANTLEARLKAKDDFYTPKLADKKQKLAKISGQLERARQLIDSIWLLLPEDLRKNPSLEDALIATLAAKDDQHHNEVTKINSEYDKLLAGKDAQIKAKDTRIELLEGTPKKPKTVENSSQIEELNQRITELEAQNKKLEGALNKDFSD